MRKTFPAVTVFLLGATWSTLAKDPLPSFPLPGQREAANLKEAGFQSLFDGKSFAGWDFKPWHEGHFTIQGNGVIDYDGKAEGVRGKGQDNHLWTANSFSDFTFYVEWRLPREPVMKEQPIVLYNGDFLMERDNPKKRATRPRLFAGDSGFYFRGSTKCQANIWSQELGSGEINGYRTDKNMPPETRRGCIPMRFADRSLGEWNAFEVTIIGDRMTVMLNGQKVIDRVHLPDLPPEGPIALQHHTDPVQFRNLWVKELE
ncbi:MAG: DUF1080 domain-containing protein [Verrucomicrobiales bacterium]